jgi:hypothetical protein
VVYPVEDLGRELRSNAIDFAMYFICFYGAPWGVSGRRAFGAGTDMDPAAATVITALWQNHVLLFDRLRHSDEVLLWLNLLLLMVVSLVPYTITVMGAFFADHNGFALNVGVFALVAALEGSMLFYTHGRPRLLDPRLLRRRPRAAGQSSLSPAAPPPPPARSYRRGHDLVLGAHVAFMPAIFLLAYLLSFAH